MNAEYGQPENLIDLAIVQEGIIIALADRMRDFHRTPPDNRLCESEEDYQIFVTNALADMGFAADKIPELYHFAKLDVELFG